MGNLKLIKKVPNKVLCLYWSKQHINEQNTK